MIKKTYGKAVAFFMILLMIVNTLLGYLPFSVQTVQAASAMTLKTIKNGTDITTIDPAFDPRQDSIITFKWNKKNGFKTVNIDNDMSPIMDVSKDATGKSVKVDNLGDKKPKIIYYKAAYDKINKTYYNVEMTVTNWKKQPFSWIDVPTGRAIPPFIRFHTTKIGISIRGLDYIDTTFKWTKYGEDSQGKKQSLKLTDEETARLRSYITLSDLDAAQAFRINEQPGIVGIYKLKGYDHIYQEGGNVVSKDVLTTDADKKAWVTAYIKGVDQFSLRFYEGMNFGNLGSGDTIRNARTSAGNIGTSYYSFTSKCLLTIPKVVDPNEPDIEKKAGDKGTSWDDAEEASDKETAYEIQDYNEFDYLVRSAGPGIETTNYTITDSLEKCLEIADASKIVITDKSGKNVTGKFNVKISGQTIQCQAKADYMASEEFKDAEQMFTMRYTVHRRKDADVRTFMAPWMDADGYTFYVPNKANVTWDAKDQETKTKDSEECWITDTINARLKVEKDAKYDGWKVGDQVEYAVEVTQTRQDAYAVNVEVTDEDIPSSLQLLNGSWEVSGPNNGTAASMSSLGENGWIVTCPVLQYGDSILIRFKCLALADSNGKDTINTAKATAENFFDENKEQTFTGDDAEVWVNTPELTVDKTANAYEYQVGDKVQYKVIVRNTKDYTVAQNVVVSDISLPDGLDIADETGIQVQFSPETAASQIGWPVADGTTSIKKQMVENHYSADRTGNTWTVQADFLPSDAAMTITFDCIASKAVNGIETQNQVSVTASNFADEQGNSKTAQDDAEVYVNTAAFSIDKHITDGNYEWQVGDHVPFDIIVRNINDEGTVNLADSDEYYTLPEEEKAKIGAAGKTVARNVVISDTDIPAGFRLDTDTVSVEAVPEETQEYSQGEYAANAEEIPDTYTEYEETPETEELMLEQEAYEPQEEEAQYSEEDQQIPEEEMRNSEQEDDLEEDSQEPADTLEIPETYAHPAEPITVTGIPERYENHVSGSQDVSNQLNPQQYNETVDTPIIWNLETVGNGWELKISDLPAGYDVKVHFTCEALEASNGQEGVNIGTVTADNAVPRSDDSEAYVNTAVLSVQKDVINRYASGGEEDKKDNREDYEFRVGEDILYQVVLKNVQPGSIARNVVLSDISLPDGMMLKDGEDAVTVTGIPSEYVNPVAGTEDIIGQLDPEHYKETEILPVSYQMTRETNSWSLSIDNLPCTENDSLNQWNQPVVVTFHCVATDAVNGWEIINTAKASADNAEPVQDSERIWINSPVLNVQKEADRDEYLVGDTITYQVDVTQDQIGCVARNLIITDRIDTEGVKLQKNSIVLLDKDGHRLNIPEENIDITGNTFTVYTGLHLIKEQGYYNWDAENGGLTEKGNYNPINVEEYSRLTLEYAVEITDRSLAGQSIHNTVTVNSDENIPKDTDETVPVDGPALDITKESDKAEYLVGETGVYKLTVRELREGVTAKQIVIKDSFDTDGAVILMDTLTVKMNGKEIDGAKISEQPNGFLIETGQDMTVEDKIEVTYRVLFESPSLDGKYVVNTAYAKGENTKEETQDNTVVVVDEGPSLEITKKSDKRYYKVGETGHYTVTVKQTEKGAAARNVIIKDELYTDGARILPGTILIRNNAGRVMDEAEIEYSDLRYAIYTGTDLGYKETFTVSYDVLFEKESLAGSDILNVARVTCDNNKVNQKEPEPIRISDGLTVYKYADPATGSVVKKGDTITYIISVKNTSDQAKAMVLVKDQIPEYTEYVKDYASGKENVTAGTKELNGHLYAVFAIQNLAAGSEETVSFQVKVREEVPEDEMLLNVAQVRETKASSEDITEDTWNHSGFRNTNETTHYLDTRWVKDSNTVQIEGGSLSIEKTSDKANYAVGETGHYTLLVTQGKEGAVSKNVVIKDSLKNKGAKILTDTIRVEKTGQDMNNIQIKATESGFTIHTHADLAYGEQMTVTYDVLFEDESLSGKSVHNVAVAKGDETPDGEEPKDDNTVTVGKAGLSISKTSDKKEYKVGETAHYTLEVRTTADDFTAENVIIKDVMKQKGANLIAGTVKVYLDEKLLDKTEVQELDNGFIAITHTNLSGVQVMKVTYDVTMEKSSLAGRDIQNTASADADNTRPAETTYSVKVPEGKNPENPSPTVTPASPTETPSEKGEPVLTITKKTDQTEAKPGSTVTYTVEVKNTGNETAKEVVIIDNLKNNKAILQKDTIKTYLQGKSFTPKKISAVSSGFRIETGKDLEKGQAVQVVYQVKLDATIKSSEVRNVASASAQNAERAETEQTLRIPSNSSENPQNPGNSDSTLKDTSASLKGNVQTGDRSPVKLIVIIGVLGIAGLIAYFSGKGRKRR